MGTTRKAKMGTTTRTTSTDDDHHDTAQLPPRPQEQQQPLSPVLLPDLPRGPFDQFLAARWNKALELGQSPNAARFLAACRGAFDRLDDITEWEARARKDEARFAHEYTIAMEQATSSTNSTSVVRRTASPSSASGGGSSTSETSSSQEGRRPPVSALTFSPASSTSCADHSFSHGSDRSLLLVEERRREPDVPSKSLAECGSMSDLAPFVAAVLRDKVLSDLLEDVQTLKAEARDLKRKHRRERILQKALLAVTTPQDASPIKSRAGVPVYAWAEGYSNPQELTRVPPKAQWARWQIEDRCKFKDLLLCHLMVEGESVGSLAEAHHYTVKVVAPGFGQGVGDDLDPEIVFGIALGKHHKVEFAARCKVSRDDLLILLGRPNFPANPDDIEVEQIVELDFLLTNIKPESRVRFLWAKKEPRTSKKAKQRRSCIRP